jgi:peroxiredoxin
MPVSPGAAAPSASASGLSGAAVDLAALAAERPVLLFFFRSDCPTSGLAAHVLPRLAALQRVAVAAVSQDGEAETSAFAEAHAFGAAVRVLRDPEPWPASSAYGVVVTPTFVLLAAGGRVEAIAEGWSRDEANALAARAAALAGEAPVRVSSTADGPAFRPG